MGFDLANLENLDGACLVRVYTSIESEERVYIWFGGIYVGIYNSELEEIDCFALPDEKFLELASKLEEKRRWVDQQIEIHEDEQFIDEPFTDDIFYSHDYNTGEDLEVQQCDYTS